MTDILSADDIFNENDFKSFKIEFLEARNLTTNTEIKDRSSMTLEEFTDRTLVLQLREKCAAVGHNLMLYLQILMPSRSSLEKEEISLTCRIQTVESLGDGFDRVTVNLVQYEEKIWIQILARFDDRQNQIMDFFKAAKG